MAFCELSLDSTFVSKATRLLIVFSPSIGFTRIALVGNAIGENYVSLKY